MARPHIQVLLADAIVPDCLRAALARTNATAAFWPLSEALANDRAVAADALVIVLPDDMTALSGALRTLFDHLAERPRATLVITPKCGAEPHFEHPPTLPVTTASAPGEEELAVRLATMLEMRESLDSLHRGLLANRRSGESVAKRYMSQLQLASQVQRGFLPDTLPRFGRVSFNVLFRPVDYVSGDIYDVHQLDEDHVGIALADASGHGIPAALLTVYIKRALRGKEIENGSYRILSPDEVLRGLNEDILEAHLSDCPFVAAIYGVLNTRTLELSLARGGAPYPILRTADGGLRAIEPPGSIVGVLSNVRFGVETVRLEPGQSVLVYSDGLERIVSPRQTARDVPEELRQAADKIAGWTTQAAAAAPPDAGVSMPDDAGGVVTATLTATSSESVEHISLTPTPGPADGHPSAPGDLIAGSAWYATLRTEGPEVAMEQIAARQQALRRMGYPLDDLTVLSLHVD